MFSPPVQPISSITSGTGSVITMWLEATRERVAEAAEAGGGAVHGQHGGAGPHRAARASSRVASRDEPSRRACARGGGRRPRSPSRGGRATSRAGCTFAAVRQEHAAEEGGRGAAGRDLVARQRHAPPRARRPPRTPRRRSSQSPSCASLVATCSVPPARYHASTPCSSHHAPIPCTARSEARHTSTARASPTAVAQDRQVVPERRDEAAVPSARPVPREPGLEHDDVEPGLERLQLPRRPEPEVAAADDDDVRRRVAVERRASARPALPPRASSRSACAACADPTAPAREDESDRLGSTKRRFPGNRRFPASGIRACDPGSALADLEILQEEYRWRTGLEPATTGITTRGSTN